MAPEEINECNKGEVFVNLYGEGLSMNDPIRMAKMKGVFTPGYEPNWTDEIAFVKGVTFPLSKFVIITTTKS